MSAGPITAIPVRGIPEVRPKDSLAKLVVAALRKQRERLRAGDILVVKHKVVAKAEGCMRKLSDVKPSARAQRWAKRWKHNARLAELALQDAARVVRAGHGVLITETRQGLVCANSGVDLSNVDGGETAVLLPADSDASARKIHNELRRAIGLHIPVLVADSFGRPWREGLTEAAIGVAGMEPLHDFRGRLDPHGYQLHATAEAVADELACLAGLACGKLQRTPACIIRGFAYRKGKGSSRPLIRSRERDLFR